MKDPIKDFIDTKNKLEKKYPGYSIEISQPACLFHDFKETSNIDDGGDDIWEECTKCGKQK